MGTRYPQGVLLNVSGVRKLYAAEIVLDNITFRLEDREKVALVGRNGVGKTTLLRILTGQESPTLDLSTGRAEPKSAT